MSKLTITKEVARKLYPESPDWFKNQLEGEFGKTCFIPKEFETIKTFEDACSKLSIDSSSVFSSLDLPDEIAYKKLKVIAKAINNGWVPNWNNSGEAKYWPWFNLSSGFGFSTSGFSYDRASTIVGSRLCFESREQSDYCATQFLDLYKQVMTI